MQLQIWNVVFEIPVKIGVFQPGFAFVTVPLLLPLAKTEAARPRDKINPKTGPRNFRARMRLPTNVSVCRLDVIRLCQHRRPPRPKDTLSQLGPGTPLWRRPRQATTATGRCDVEPSRLNAI